MDDSQETIKKIKTLLRFHHNGLTISDISQKLQLNRNSTAKYLEILRISGEVNLNTYGPAKVYTFSQKMPISAMLKFSADIILLVDNELCVLDANENALRILDMSRKDLVGNPVDQISSPLIARLAIPEVFEDIQKTGEILREFSMVIHNENHHFRARIIPTVFDNLNEGLTIIGEDITKQIRFEESLMISEARYRATVEDQNEFICRFEPGGKLTFMNDAYCRYFGLNKEKCIGHHHTVSIPVDDARLVKKHLASLTPENPVATIEHRIQMPDGSIVWHFWSDRAIFNADDQVIEYLSVGRDITKRKVVEEALVKSEQLYRTILDNIQDIYYRADNDGNVSMASPSVLHLLGYSSLDEIIGQNISEKLYYVPADRAGFLAALRSEKKVTDYEITLRKKDGSPVIVSTNSHILYDTVGNEIGIEGFFRDITKRKRAEQALREGEERFRMITELSPYPISIIDREGNFRYVNKMFEQVFGYTLADIPTQHDWFERAFHNATELAGSVNAGKRIADRAGQDMAEFPIFPVTCRNGTVLRIRFHPITLGNGERFVAYEDLTNKAESERLHSVLASIINTSNNPVTLYRNLHSFISVNNESHDK